MSNTTIETRQPIRPVGKNVFRCHICRHVAVFWMPNCPSCGEINTLVDIKVSDLLKMGESVFPETEEEDEEDNEDGEEEEHKKDDILIELGEIDDTEPVRFSSGDDGLDCVLGGGLVPGSVIALYGPPGCGKSTLLTKVATKVANNTQVLYAAGEESAGRVSRRVRRLKLLRESPHARRNLIVIQNANETDVVCALIMEQRPSLAIVDSFGSLESERSTGRAGGPSQVAYAAKMLVDVARASQASIIAIGHETKDGSMAGPSVARHEVDTLLVFEHIELKKDGTIKKADMQTGILRLRADGKNRDGDTAAMWIYRMTEHGLLNAEDSGDAEEKGSPKNRRSNSETNGGKKGPARKASKAKPGGLERAVRS